MVGREEKSRRWEGWDKAIREMGRGGGRMGEWSEVRKIRGIGWEGREVKDMGRKVRKIREIRREGKEIRETGRMGKGIREVGRGEERY